jgi:hypothetical protein
MSKGFGSVQRRLIEVFELAPNKCFTVIELAEQVYQSTQIGEAQRVAVRRALDGLVVKLGVKRFRQGFGPRSWSRKAKHLGWHYEYGLFK